MKFSDGAQDAARPGSDAARSEGNGGEMSEEQARSLRTQEPVRDIQDLIDKLAAVTRQLDSSHHGPDRVPGPAH